MTGQIFTIKPLHWRSVSCGEWRARTIFGEYHVVDSNTNISDFGSDYVWQFSPIVCEMGFKTFAEASAAAEKHYLERLYHALEPVIFIVEPNGPGYIEALNSGDGGSKP